MKNQWRVIVGALLVFLIVLFAVLNSQSVPVSFGFVKITGPLILIIIGSAVLGLLVGLLASLTTIWKQKKKIKVLEEEVSYYNNHVETIVQEKLAQENATFLPEEDKDTVFHSVGSRLEK